jgi:hypothetical protein
VGGGYGYEFPGETIEDDGPTQAFGGPSWPANSWGILAANNNLCEAEDVSVYAICVNAS